MNISVEQEKNVINHLIDMFRSEIAWTENNFLPGPNGDLYILKRNHAIELLEEYRDETLAL